MKRFTFMLMITALFLSTMIACNHTATAQVKLYKTSSLIGTIDSMKNSTKDTVANTGTKYFLTKPGAINRVLSGSYCFYFTFKSVGGTPATAYCTIEGSYNGYDWFRLTGNPGVDGRNCDSLSQIPSTTQTQYKITSLPGGGKYVYGAQYFNTGNAVLYARLKVVGTGTQKIEVDNVYLITK